MYVIFVKILTTLEDLELITNKANFKLVISYTDEEFKVIKIYEDYSETQYETTTASVNNFAGDSKSQTNGCEYQNIKNNFFFIWK